MTCGARAMPSCDSDSSDELISAAPPFCESGRRYLKDVVSFDYDQMSPQLERVIEFPVFLETIDSDSDSDLVHEAVTQTPSTLNNVLRHSPIRTRKLLIR